MHSLCTDLLAGTGLAEDQNARVTSGVDGQLGKLAREGEVATNEMSQAEIGQLRCWRCRRCRSCQRRRCLHTKRAMHAHRQLLRQAGKRDEIKDPVAKKVFELRSLQSYAGKQQRSARPGGAPALYLAQRSFSTVDASDDDDDVALIDHRERLVQ